MASSRIRSGQRDNNGILSELGAHGTFGIIRPNTDDVTRCYHPDNGIINISNYHSEPAPGYLVDVPDCQQVFGITTLVQNELGGSLQSTDVIMHRTLKPSYGVHGGNVTEKLIPDASVSYDYHTVNAYHTVNFQEQQKIEAPANNRVAQNDSTAYQPYRESFDIGLSAYVLISTMSLLWTAAFTMVVVFVLHLPTTSMTNKVDMVSVWTGLGGTLDVGRIFNLLGRLLHATGRKSSSAKNTIENDIFVSKNSSSYVYGASYSTAGYCKVYKHFNGMGLYDNG